MYYAKKNTKVVGLFDPRRPATVARAKRVCERKRTHSTFNLLARLNFTNFRRKLSIFKLGVRLNFWIFERKCFRAYIETSAADFPLNEYLG